MHNATDHPTGKAASTATSIATDHPTDKDNATYHPTDKDNATDHPTDHPVDYAALHVAVLLLLRHLPSLTTHTKRPSSSLLYIL